MAGLSKDTPIPSEIKLHQKSHVLEIAFDNGSSFRLPYEFLRVFSPSAEVRGHGPGQEVLQTGKKDVAVVDLQPIGQYAVKLIFSDGHDTGIYSWDLLYSMGVNQDAMWLDYLSRVKSACASREGSPGHQPVGGGCGSMGGGHSHGGGCGHKH